MFYQNLYNHAKYTNLCAEAASLPILAKPLVFERVSEHQGVSPQTGKIVKGTLSTSICIHILKCDHIATWNDFKVLERESNQWLLEIKESLFIKRDKPSLNKNIYSQELFLF